MRNAGARAAEPACSGPRSPRRIFSPWMKWRREKARPHPNLLPQEKELSRAAHRVIERARAHDNLRRAKNTMADEHCSLSQGRGPGWVRARTDRAATLLMTRAKQKLSGSLATVPRCAGLHFVTHGLFSTAQSLCYVLQSHEVSPSLVSLRFNFVAGRASCLRCHCGQRPRRQIALRRLSDLHHRR